MRHLTVSATAVKLAVFTVVMILVLAGLAVVFSQTRFARESRYHAVFTNSSGIVAGAKVRIAGVPVGSVHRVFVGGDHLAHVDFAVDRQYRLYTSTRASIRYENLVGDRYLELSDGKGTARGLPAGGVIGTDHTQPALDLDVLLGGFKPLLRGLDPARVNDITGALLQVLQGQGGALVALLNDAGSFTATVAQRDELIGGVIEHLKTVLATIDDRDHEFDTTLTELRRLVSGLAADRDPIGAALPRLAGATSDLTDLLRMTRPDLKSDIDAVGQLATTLDDHSSELQWVLDNLPDTYRRLVRIGSYGSFLNMYVCGTNFLVDGPDGQPVHVTLPGMQTTGRCAP